MYCEKKTEMKQNKVKVTNNKETEVREVKEISRQEEMQKYYESRQVGGTEKTEEKSKEVPLKDRKKE